jgi:sirohydrochlorin ferrochelatase
VQSAKTAGKTAVIILFHGSRTRGAKSTPGNIVAGVRRRGARDLVVEAAFMQYQSPRLETSIRKCVALGARRVFIVPFFMQPGSHVTRDLPALVEKARPRHAGVELRTTDFAGAHPLMEKIILDLVKQAGRTTKPAGPDAVKNAVR